MRNTSKQTLRLAQLAILIALEAVLTFTPLGFIMVPPISITLMHIPVIVGAVLMGPVDGGILGHSFGVISMIKASTAAASSATGWWNGKSRALKDPDMFVNLAEGIFFLPEIMQEESNASQSG